MFHEHSADLDLAPLSRDVLGPAFQRAFEQAREGLLLVDAGTGRISAVNAKLARKLGRSNAELVGASLWDLEAACADPAASSNGTSTALRRTRDPPNAKGRSRPLAAGTHLQLEVVKGAPLGGDLRVVRCRVRDQPRGVPEDEDDDGSGAFLQGELLASLVRMMKRERDLLRLHRLNRALHVSRTLSNVADVVAQTMSAMLPGQSGYLAVALPGSKRAEVVAHWGAAPVPPSFALATCCAVSRRAPHEVRDAEVGPPCAHLGSDPTEGSLCVPLLGHGEPVGVLCLLGTRGAGARAALSRRLALAMGESIGWWIANIFQVESLRTQATVDALTGLHNRRFLEDSLVRELHRARRLSSPLCAAMIDLDHFKLLNDTHGHEVGDNILRELGTLLRDNVRRSDIACRYGGDEFVLVFPDSTLASARERLEVVRALVARTSFGKDVRQAERITVSIGLAQAAPQSIDSRRLLLAADQALYQGKRNGRDRVVAVAAPC